MGTKFDNYKISSLDNEDGVADISLGFSSHTDCIYLEQEDNNITLKEYQLIDIVETLVKKGAINAPKLCFD